MFSAPGLLLRAAERSDIPLIAHWMSDPRILKFYGGCDRPLDEEKIRQKYFRRRRDPATGRFYEYRACIVEVGKTGKPGWQCEVPAAFVQYYRLPPSEVDMFGYPLYDRSYGFDLFLGEPELWGTGVGSQVVELMRDYLCHMRGAVRVVLDPRLDNPRDIHAYVKARFRKIRVLPGREVHEGSARDCQLMEYP